MLHYAGVWVCARCAAQGFCSIPGQSQPHKILGLTLPCTRMAAGVHQSPTQTRDLNCPWYISTAQPTMGGNTAGTTTKCHSKLLNNKRYRKKLISITHIAICKPPKAPGCTPTLSCSAFYLSYCHSPSSIQGTVWSLVELCVLIGL